MFDRSYIVVQAHSCENIQAGDSFYCQLNGPRKISLFHAECLSNQGSLVRLHLTTRPKVVESLEDVRVRPRGLQCLMRAAFGNSPVDVLDISPSGMAISAPFVFDKGDKTEISLQTPTGEVEAIGTVVYSRPIEASGLYRIGFKLEIPNRAMQGRWKNVFFEVA